MKTSNKVVEGAFCQPSLFSMLIQSPMPSSGPVKIIRENIKAHFGATRITQHGGEFRMWNGGDGGDGGFKVTLDPSDALWIIDELGLGAIPSQIFRRSVTWSNFRRSVTWSKRDLTHESEG